MQIKRYLLLALTCLLIQSCASSINSQRLQGGKVSFVSGDFKSAFHQLLPLAAEGIPQAEYGVGYMYYYGYGVTQDNDSGLFWMNKAASAHYPPAIRALVAIQGNTVKEEEKNKPSSESTPTRMNDTHAENTKIDKDAVLEALNNTPIKPGRVTIMPQENQITKPQSLSLTDTHSKKYTLQLLGSYYLSSLKQRQLQLNLGVPTYIAQTKYNGRDWYVLTYGQYPALSHAALAKLDLPQKIKDFKPWIRKCDELTWVG